MRRCALRPLLSGATLAAGLLAVTPAVASAQARAAATIGCDDISALNAAITAANAGTGPSEIVLAANCVYTISAPAGSSTFGPVGLPEVTRTVTLIGEHTTIQHADNGVLFRIAAVSGTTAGLTVQGITASGGLVSGSGGCYAATAGAVLMLRNSAVTDCTAFANGGGIIVNLDATATIYGSVLRGNSGGSGGAIYADELGAIGISNSVLSGNQAALGGAIFTGGRGLTVIASTITSNAASEEGGGVYNSTSPMLLGGATLQYNTAGTKGGAISNYGLSTLRNTVITGNRAPEGGGIWQGGGRTTPIISLIFGNTPNNCRPVGSVPGCYT